MDSYSPRPKSRIFRISGSHKSRYSQILSARPVPNDSFHREEAIEQRVEQRKLPFYVTHVRVDSIGPPSGFAAWRRPPSSRIFRISGSRKSRYSQKLSARPVPIDSSHREEAIDVSHARIRAATGKLAHGQIQDFPESITPGTRKFSQRDRYQSTQLAETKRLTYHTSGSERQCETCPFT
ncbi:hypothetical protein DdX_16764 [Ditylenchus destructor]|uniref:Uncharacterized protein n=1 Tax=Ditylenchus destructor TaxID=166010 RepID=A0AAD4MT12_9BILA|nr:hypothetical protein DdX_16764 [Ditylenchus destructor]